MSELETVQRMYQAFRERDTAVIRELLDPQVEWIQNDGFPGGGRRVGVDAVLTEVFGKLRGEWDGWQTRVDEMRAVGDTVFALGEYRGRNRATGRTFTAAFAHVYTLRGGRIVRFRQYTDTLRIAEATQAAPEPAAAAG